MTIVSRFIFCAIHFAYAVQNVEFSKRNPCLRIKTHLVATKPFVSIEIVAYTARLVNCQEEVKQMERGLG